MRRPGGRAATTGDLCLTGNEVQPVMQALAQAGLEITARHNHMIDTSPMTCFVRWFGTGTPVALAQELRGVLNHANCAKAASS